MRCIFKVTKLFGSHKGPHGMSWAFCCNYITFNSSLGWVFSSYQSQEWFPNRPLHKSFAQAINKKWCWGVNLNKELDISQKEKVKYYAEERNDYSTVRNTWQTGRNSLGKCIEKKQQGLGIKRVWIATWISFWAMQFESAVFMNAIITF